MTKAALPTATTWERPSVPGPGLSLCLSSLQRKHALYTSEKPPHPWDAPSSAWRRSPVPGRPFWPTVGDRNRFLRPNSLRSKRRGPSAASTPLKTVYKLFTKTCEDGGIKRPISIRTFSKRLREGGFGLETAKRNGVVWLRSEGRSRRVGWATMPIINWLRSIFGGLFGKPAPYLRAPARGENPTTETGPVHDEGRPRKAGPRRNKHPQRRTTPPQRPTGEIV